MVCPRCEVCAPVPDQSGLVFLKLPTPALKPKIDNLIQQAGVSTKENPFRVPSFSVFLKNFLSKEELTSVEKKDIQLLFLPDGTSLSFESLTSVRTLLQWESLLEADYLVEILQQERLVTYFHPIWDLKSKTIFGYECLIRGYDAQGNYITPSRLFSTASKSDLVFNLDRQARLTALKTASKFQHFPRIFINFVPTSVYDPVFCLASTVETAIQLHIAPSRIVFEVVETEQIDDWNHLNGILNYYRNMGFMIALDDVGSGYSSLNRLVHVRPDIIKVDLHIVRGIDKDPLKQSVFRGLSQICKEGNIMLLAEGVETKEELAFIESEGAWLAQGFLWGAPSPEIQQIQFINDPD